MKKLLCIIRTQMRCIFRRRSWRAVLGAGLFFSLGFFWYPYARHADAMSLINQTVYGQAVFSLCFLAMGIELRRETRREHLDDLIASYSRHAAFFPLAQIAAIGLMAAAATLLLCAGFALPLALDGAHILWIRQILLQTVLFYFLPCFTYGAAGLLLSHLIPGKNVYLAAVALYLPTSTLSVYFLGNLTLLSPGWRLFFSFINLGLNDYRIAWNFVSGPPIELPRWVVRCVFCALAVCLYIFCYGKDALSDRRAVRRAAWRTGAAAVCGVLTLSLLCARYRVFFSQFACDMFTQDVTAAKCQEYKTSGERPAEKNITLQKTDISLSCTTQGLSAEVTLMAAADSAIGEQAFTLYSDLTVDDVLVDGEKAVCTRVHDSLTVRFPRPKAAGEEICFTFRYHGYGLPLSPVNETTVQLGHSFPWLPWPGVRTHSFTEIAYYGEGGAFRVADWQQGDPVAYTLRYRGPGNLYTNLSGAGEGIYTGVSRDGVALYSGMVHSRWHGVDVYVPPLLYKKSELYAETALNAQPFLQALCERMGAPKRPEAPASVVVLLAEEPVWSWGGPNTIFTRGSLWEFHMPRSCGSAAVSLQRDAGAEAFQSSAHALYYAGFPYLLSPASGYPADVPWFSTQCLANLMRFSALAPEMDADSMAFDLQMFCANYFDRRDESMRQDAIEKYGVSFPDIPPEKSARQAEEVLEQMHEGTVFEPQLRALYQRLLRGEPIAPAEMVQFLYDSMEA